MKIIWDNLYEVKKFINVVDLEKVRKYEDDRGWGCAGFIIRESDSEPESKSDGKKAEKRSVSQAYHDRDYVILTPCYKELTWLYRLMKDYPRYGVLGPGSFDEGFWAACLSFFIEHKKKNYEAEELLRFVVDFLGSMERSAKAERRIRQEEEE